MPMIFDHFPSETQAARFRATVEREHDLETAAFDSAADAQVADPIPVDLVPPIVHVERTDEETERVIELDVAAFGGRFVGT